MPEQIRVELAALDAGGGIGPAILSLGDAEAVVLGSAQQETHLRQLLDALPAAIYTTDAAGRITFYNEAAAELAGRRPELGKDLWCVTWRLYQPDGTPLPHDQCPMAIALKENRPVRGAEAIAERPDGTRVPFIPFPTPLRDESGRLVGAVNMLIDISERKAAEEKLRASEERYRRLSAELEELIADRTWELSEAVQKLRAEAAERERVEAALRQSQKMEAVGQLASGVAHDFNNLLTAVLGNLELVEERLKDESLRKMVQAAARAALRGAQLNEQMLAFSRKQHLAPRTVDLNGLVRDMSDLLQRTLGGTVQVETALAADLWPALVDPTQIELVILNLAINARDALPLGGTVRIETRNVGAGQGPGALGSGECVCISVADNGIGMSEAVLARACEPFFTTKPPGKGSGLGLSQVYGVAHQSGGDVAIRSEPGRGTTVEVYLPRSAREVAPGAMRRKAKPRVAEPRALTVLIVDDQADVREVAVAHLESLGYRVIEAGDGRTALRLIEHGEGVDVLLADYAMAEMNGVELARAARQRRPDLAVVIMTGYSDMGPADLQVSEAVLLKKPYRLHELGRTIDKAAHWGERALADNIVPLHRA